MIIEVNRSQYLSLGAVKNLARAIKKSHTLIESTVTTRLSLFATYTKLDAKEKRTIGRHTKRYKELITFGDKEKGSLYELGIIALFANFESFQYDLLCELFGKYPNAYSKEPKIDVQELSKFKTIKQAKNFYIDAYAVDQSRSLVTWEKFVRDTFGIVLFKEERDFQYFKLLNEVRNIFMHSAGKLSSEFHKKAEAIYPGENFAITLRAKLRQDKQKMFRNTYYLIEQVAKGSGFADTINLNQSATSSEVKP